MKIKRIWVYLESVRPCKWGVREGNKYHIVDEILIHGGTLESAIRKNQPRCYFYGDGTVDVVKGTAYVSLV